LPLLQGLQTVLEHAEANQLRQPIRNRKVAVEQWSHYLAASDGAAIDYFETVAPHLRILFNEQDVEHFASLIENYAFSEA